MEKISVSSALSDLVFDRESTKTEIEALHRRCEGYQKDDFAGWDETVLFPYSQYFGFLASMKMRAVLEEAYRWGYLSDSYKLIDIGAGTLGASLGAMDFCREKGIAIHSLRANDKDLVPTRWAAKRFASLLPETHLSESFPKTEKHENYLVILSDILSENHLQCHSWDSLQNSRFGRDLVRLLRSLSEKSLLIIVEPAHKKANQSLMKFRDLVSKESTILLPCPHQEKCPALQQDEWCHEERHFEAPFAFTQLVHKLGFERRYLQFSQLVVGPQNSAFSAEQARVVSRQLKSKGRCDKWLCRNGERFKVSQMLRRINDTNKAYFESERGDVLDSQVLDSISTIPSTAAKS